MGVLRGVVVIGDFFKTTASGAVVSLPLTVVAIRVDEGVGDGGNTLYLGSAEQDKTFHSRA